MITRKTTQELLYDSLHELVLKKSVEKISVTEITTNCGMTPQLSTGISGINMSFWHGSIPKYRKIFMLIFWLAGYPGKRLFLRQLIYWRRTGFFTERL